MTTLRALLETRGYDFVTYQKDYKLPADLSKRLPIEVQYGDTIVPTYAGCSGDERRALRVKISDLLPAGTSFAIGGKQWTLSWDGRIPVLTDAAGKAARITETRLLWDLHGSGAEITTPVVGG